MSEQVEHNEKVLSTKQRLVFFGKSRLLMAKRLFKDLNNGPSKLHVDSSPFSGKVIGESVTALWRDENPKERDLTAGKIQNLRVACIALNNIIVPKGKTFSFWKHIGRTTKRKGYVLGREVREGCIIPTMGGGICQLSNALYDSCLKAGIEVTERHGHTEVIAGSLAEQNRDATVFWNYVDFRFKAHCDIKIQAYMTHDNLVIRLLGEQSGGFTVDDVKSRDISEIGNCYSCGKTDCSMHVDIKSSDIKFGKQALVLDAMSPWVNDYILNHINESYYAFLPLDGHKLKKAQYKWKLKADKSYYFTFDTLKRSRAVRGLGPKGKLQEVLYNYDYSLGRKMAKKIPYDVSHVVVAQNLLPALWDSGVLWGRSFDVIMTRLPMKNLQSVLDEAHNLHPTSTTLADFRVSKDIVDLEWKALSAASRVITTHSGIRDVFGSKAVYIPEDIKFGEAKETVRDYIMLGGPALARKGVYEFLAAFGENGYKLCAPGKAYENDSAAEKIEALPTNWREIVKALILPAYVEHSNVWVKRAMEAGIPCIVSKNCGLQAQTGLIVLDELSPSSIQAAYEKLDLE